jgi:hypothetical protein
MWSPFLEMVGPTASKRACRVHEVVNDGLSQGRHIWWSRGTQAPVGERAFCLGPLLQGGLKACLGLVRSPCAPQFQAGKLQRHLRRDPGSTLGRLAAKGDMCYDSVSSCTDCQELRR